MSACEELYDKNIQTLSTSANKKDIEYGSAHIVINFDSLSTENQEIGRKLGDVSPADGMNQLGIKIPISENSSVEEIERFAQSIAHQFKKQEMTWAPTWTLEQVRKFFGLEPDDEQYGVEAFTDQLYYDEDQKLFYLSQEHAQKAQEKIEP